MPSFRPALVWGASAIAISALINNPMPAAAQQGTAAVQPKGYNFNIPSKPLLAALADFTATTGIQVVRPGGGAIEGRSGAVRGQLSPNDALGRLLAGTDLDYSFVNAGTVSVRQRGTSAAVAPVVEGAILLDTITITGGKGKAADIPYETPGSSTYISEQKIERFRGTSAGDFLDGTPGVMVGAKRTSNAVDVNIRGMQGMDRVPVSVDGAQQSNTLYRGYAGVASRTYIDPDFIGGVMIEKGPTLSVDGSGATGGVVRMSTIGAADVLKEGASYGIRVRGGMIGNSTTPPPMGTRGGIDTTLLDAVYTPETMPSSFGFTDGLDRPPFFVPNSGFGSITAAARNESFEIVAGYARRKTGNYYAGKRGGYEGRVQFDPVAGGERVTLGGLTNFQAGEEVLNSSTDNTSYLLKGVAKGENGHRLELSYTKYLSTYFEMFPSQVIWFGGPFHEAPSTVDLDTYTATYTWKPDDNALIDFRANLWKTHVDFDVAQTVPVFGSFWTTRTGTIADRWGLNLSNTSRLETAFGDLSLSYGGSYTDEAMAQIRRSDAFPPYLMEPTYEPGKSGDRQEWSGFGAAQWKPVDWLTLDAGLRYTSTETHDHCLYFTEDACKGTSNSGFAPLATATVEPWDGIQFYARYAEGIRSPSLYEATKGESFTVSPRFDLVPEHARNWEAGINVLRDDVFAQGDNLRLKAAYFDNNIDNYITRTWAGKNPGTFTLRNLDNARFKGIELSGGYDMGRLFTEFGYTRYLSTSFCLTPEDAVELRELVCNEGGVDGGYVQAHLPPQQTTTLTLGARFLEDKLTVGGRINYVGKRAVDGINDKEEGWTSITKWKPYTVVDIFANWKVTDNMQAEFNIDNLTDVYYVDALSVGLVPAPGRTFRASLTARF